MPHTELQGHRWKALWRRCSIGIIVIAAATGCDKVNPATTFEPTNVALGPLVTPDVGWH